MIEKFKILVPIDGSEHSRRTMDVAVEIAEQRQAELFVVQVMEPVNYDEGSDLFRDLHLPSQAEHADKGFAAIESSVRKSNVTWERVVSNGVPADKILELAETHAVNLIVIGRHGSNALTRFLLGSVSDRIVRHASCDVYVVH
jgi:nucleotide-binding universal stress UspA family protein